MHFFNMDFKGSLTLCQALQISMICFLCSRLLTLEERCERFRTKRLPVIFSLIAIGVIPTLLDICELLIMTSKRQYKLMLEVCSESNDFIACHNWPVVSSYNELISWPSRCFENVSYYLQSKLPLRKRIDGLKSSQRDYKQWWNDPTAATGIGIHDLLFKNPLRYPLSYTSPL